jgi:hypothetical protein
MGALEEVETLDESVRAITTTSHARTTKREDLCTPNTVFVPKILSLRSYHTDRFGGACMFSHGLNAAKDRRDGAFEVSYEEQHTPAIHNT